MKIVGVAGSPRHDKSSKFLLERCLQSVRSVAADQQEQIETELIDLAGMEFSGCISCNLCKKGLQCSLQDDFQPLLEKLAAPDIAGIILATPVYMGSMTAQMKAFIDRTVAHRRNGFLFRDKVGAAIAVGGSRNGGQELTIQAVHAAMMIHDMVIVGDGGHFGGIAWGNHPGGYAEDNVGIATAEKLGERVAHLALRLS
ncbi:flavodoxin family protein [Desulfotalea psychrophila]|uniref:Related to iron-sulfur flavoprotein n=1 Tax=Desulfotalea psychrophila (strain LSv54 / DSM 12343) TaxID=177439 RepID=Q6ANT6_DESPS|nr:flavodoxin family protein [Desulfotalea psychrophila]CAG35988.1 related to iron-sulfur flavoprotein [Desulfotalea psychrophila LSv54]